MHSPEVREAYRRGARECYESAIPFVRADTERAILSWLKELDAWEVGDPPKSPQTWTMHDPF